MNRGLGGSTVINSRDEPTPPALDSAEEATSSWYFVPLPNADYLNKQLESTQSAFVPVPGPLEATCAIAPEQLANRVLVRMPNPQVCGNAGGVITLTSQRKDATDSDIAETRRIDLVNYQFEKLERVLASSSSVNGRLKRPLNKTRVLSRAVDSIQELRNQLQAAQQEISHLRLENDQLRHLLNRPDSVFQSPAASFLDDSSFTCPSIGSTRSSIAQSPGSIGAMGITSPTTIVSVPGTSTPNLMQTVTPVLQQPCQVDTSVVVLSDDDDNDDRQQKIEGDEDVDDAALVQAIEDVIYGENFWSSLE